MDLFINILLLIVGFILLVKGADFFVDGASSIAKFFKIPALVIGLTLVSIGTSLPEISVSISSAIKGQTDISYGNVIGSNIFNIFIVIGACAIIKPLVVPKDIIKLDTPIYIGIIAVLALFVFGITPLVIEWYEALILFFIFLAYLGYMVYRGFKEPEITDIKEETKEKTYPMWINFAMLVGGGAAIIIGGDIVVENASKIAAYFKMSELLIGLTIVAMGTSLPELVTSLVAVKKGQVDIAVGNAVGSCIFNIILIIGIAGLIKPIPIDITQYIDFIAMAVGIILMFIYSFKSQKISRWQGISFILIYAAYLAYIIIRN